MTRPDLPLTVYADPPWPLYCGGKIKRGANAHYPLLSIEQIRTIYADPPWRLSTGVSDPRWGTPQMHYPTMKLEQIIDLKPQCAENAHLYLWAVNNLIPEAFKVMCAWGFRYVTMITWVKDRMGMGQYYRGTTEHLLFGIKGKPLPYKLLPNGKRPAIPTHIIAARREHSRKPPKVYDIIETISYPPYLELFARHPKPRPNWSYWGDEA